MPLPSKVPPANSEGGGHPLVMETKTYHGGQRDTLWASVKWNDVPMGKPVVILVSHEWV